MSVLKRQLNRIVRLGDSKNAQEVTKKPDFAAIQALRSKIQNHLSLPLSQFCRKRPDFDAKHGLVYKILRTSPYRLQNSTLCSHDVAFWLRDHRHPSAALWVIKLAGPHHGTVSRNQLLHWLRTQGKLDVMQTVHKWTKKWGFKDTDRTLAIVSQPLSVSEAREMYKTANMESSDAKQIYGNKLLSEVSILENSDPEEVWAFFRTLNKDVVTFQVLLAAMIKKNNLRKYLPELWDLAERQEKANNLTIDSKLRETYERVKALCSSSGSGSPPRRNPNEKQP